jgi:hypothetical protein
MSIDQLSQKRDIAANEAIPGRSSPRRLLKQMTEAALDAAVRRTISETMSRFLK